MLSENRAMLEPCKAVGFQQGPDPDDPGTVRVTLRLDDGNQFEG